MDPCYFNKGIKLLKLLLKRKKKSISLAIREKEKTKGNPTKQQWINYNVNLFNGHLLFWYRHKAFKAIIGKKKKNHSLLQ